MGGKTKQREIKRGRGRKKRGDERNMQKKNFQK
jgi:hypothetical protein